MVQEKTLEQWEILESDMCMSKQGTTDTTGFFISTYTAHLYIAKQRRLLVLLSIGRCTALLAGPKGQLFRIV
jgi:hypothetical protein